MSRILPASVVAASLFCAASTAVAQRMASNEPVIFTPASTEVVPWTVARENLMRALQRSRLPRSTAELRREYMRRFLLLEPDSREAGAAREKIVLWEERARRAGTRQ